KGALGANCWLFCGGNTSRLSSAYSFKPRQICFRLLRHLTTWAFSFALDNAGRRRDARIAIMAMTTRSSIKVKAADSHVIRDLARAWSEGKNENAPLHFACTLCSECIVKGGLTLIYATTL